MSEKLMVRGMYSMRAELNSSKILVLWRIRSGRMKNLDFHLSWFDPMCVFNFEFDSGKIIFDIEKDGSVSFRSAFGRP